MFSVIVAFQFSANITADNRRDYRQRYQAVSSTPDVDLLRCLLCFCDAAEVLTDLLSVRNQPSVISI